ncbi:putative spermidine/putrescine transport system substrate-binding protein [Trinickia symbiotica]|uniref:Spermidine/putrescine ABC transporter substrate-binding protein n=1 Tax=Trinickia symbiotica TaxID=863227 RepID=A0A2N7X5L1_9BURK|nr:ABC transporter substrate-binding protein [Trinickia symbiotica]PMS36832.1 spermidine/putrescine ABC transporter substrate-binding protein [Trinickia symbiotica]PPK46287.1 putative spermidine/putrescine transport system substrate-binding protein [Trinickia symbiotica]
MQIRKTQKHARTCLFVLLSAILPVTSASAQQLVVASFGGAYTASQSKAFFEPYSAKTGTKVLPADYNGGLAELRSQVQAGSGAWDVIDLEFQDAARACDEGLIDPIKPSSLPNGQDGKPASSDFVQGSLMDCGVGTILWSNVIAYDKRKFTGAQPTTIADFFDLKRFPGKRGLSNKPNGNLEWALMADGVPRDKVYATLRTPAGLERAFKKLDTIKANAIFWGAQAQSVQLLADGEVVMTEGGNGRFTDAITKDKKPFGILWQGQIINGDVFAVSKASKNKAAALDFIRFATSAPQLAAQTKYISYAPARRSALPLVDASLRENLPTSPANLKVGLASDTAFWNDEQDEINRRWAAWMAR